MYYVGTYIRVSRDDKQADESVSVENQHTMLSQFIAHMPNWIGVRTYIDDGASGGNFNRKGFQDMMEDVRSGAINLVLVKDLSRFGRNYLEAGKYLEEELPALGCRFVALADNIDTESGENDIIPFLNAINDFYLRDASERIKSVMRAKAKDGQRLSGIPPYGYIPKACERSRLAIDSTASEVVRRIFEMRAGGFGYSAIAGILNREGIKSPRAYYFASKGRDINAPDNRAAACANMWSCRTVKLILNNEVYVGNTISFKRGARSYRDSREYRRDESEWIRVENTHIPLVDFELWSKVQGINQAAKAKMANCKPPRPNPFTGLLVCSGCKTKMSRIRKTYLCATYKRSGNAVCSPHLITEENLNTIVTSHVKGLAERLRLDENAMRESLHSRLMSNYKTDKINRAKQLKQLEQQLHNLELQIDRLYEDKTKGAITAEKFAAIAVNLEEKQVIIESELDLLKQSEQETSTKLDDIDKWTALIEEKATPLEVDRGLLEAIIEKIEIGEKYETNNQTYQNVTIHWKFVENCATNP